MELRRHLDPKMILIGLYVVVIFMCFLIGLRPAGAAEYVISGELEIPDIGLESDVTQLTLENGRLNSPDIIVGSYSTSPNKTLLIGHSTTAFHDLEQLDLNDYFYYNRVKYKIIDIEVKKKSDIHMGQILAGAEKDTVVLMTCAGELFENGDATHRLIITAVSE